MKKIVKKSLAYLLSVAAVSASFVMPMSVSAEKSADVFLEEDFDKEFIWSKTKTGTYPIPYPEETSNIWQANSSGTTFGLSAGVADPTGGNEKMMKINLPYVEGKQSFWFDNATATFTDTITGVSVVEQKFYFDSDEALFADDAYLLLQVQFNGGRQDVICIRKTGFWNSYKASKVSYGVLPRDEWFTIKFTSDFDNGKWYVDLVKKDGTIIPIRTVTQAASEPIKSVRYSYSDTVPEGKASWYGIGSYRHYKIVEKEETWREYADLTFEDDFEKEFTRNGLCTSGGSQSVLKYPDGTSTAWRATTTYTTVNVSAGVASPDGGLEKMMKVEFPYTEGETEKKIWFDNANAPANDTELKGVGVFEAKYYLDSKKSLIADGAHLQAQITNPNQFVPYVIKNDGFYVSSTAAEPMSDVSVPRDEWFKVLTVFDYDNLTFNVKLVTNDGTVTNLRTGKYSWSVPATVVRIQLNDTVADASEKSYVGIDYLRFYKLKDTEGTAEDFKSIESVGGKAAVGKEIGVKVSFENEAPELSYQWYKCLTNTGYSKDLMKLTPISGATGSTYVPTEADLGNYLYVKVFAKNNAVYPGWPSGISEIAQYPEVGNALWALDPNPFVMDYGKEPEGTSYIQNNQKVNADGSWRTHGLKGAANGTITAKVVKNVGNAVKDDALEVDVNTPAADNGFWMWEHNGFGGLTDDVISIEQKYFIPEGGAFTAGSAENIKQENRFGYGSNQEQAGATWDAYGIYNGYITSADFKTNLAPIPYGEWFGVKLVYFTKKSDDAVMYRDIVLVREDGTTENLVCGAVISNATMLAAVKNGGYRRSRTNINLVDPETKPHFYLGDFIVKTDKYYSDTPALILDKENGNVAGGAVITDYDNAGTTPVMLAVAHYQGGHLVGIKIADAEVKNDKAYKLTTSITEQVLEKGDIVKSFVFNKNTLEPLADCATLVVE